MANLAYNRSTRRERELVNEYRALGWISARSAGSKSPVDVFAINPISGETRLFQIKTKKGGRSFTQRVVWKKGNTTFYWREYA